MTLKEFNLTYFSDGIEIHSIKNSELEYFIPVYRKCYIEEYQNKISDDEIKDDICRYVRKDIFGHSMIFIISKDNKMIGYFTIWHDDMIKFKTNTYRNRIFNAGISINDDVTGPAISACIKTFVDALLSFGLNIKTLYFFAGETKRYLDNLLENGFKEMDPGLFYSKLGENIEKRGLKNGYKDKICIKNI
jgi:hypothetical protein